MKRKFFQLNTTCTSCQEKKRGKPLWLCHHCCNRQHMWHRTRHGINIRDIRRFLQRSRQQAAYHLFYIPPTKQRPQLHGKPLRRHQNLHTDTKNATIWIASDINLPHIIDLTSKPVGGSNYPKSISRRMFVTLYDTSFVQIVDITTRGSRL